MKLKLNRKEKDKILLENNYYQFHFYLTLSQITIWRAKPVGSQPQHPSHHIMKAGGERLTTKTNGRESGLGLGRV